MSTVPILEMWKLRPGGVIPTPQGTQPIPLQRQQPQQSDCQPSTLPAKPEVMSPCPGLSFSIHRMGEQVSLLGYHQEGC